MIERVAIAGTDVPLLDVFASVTIRHGRGGPDDGPLASTASLSIIGATRELTSSFRVADELAIELAGDVPRFVGRITDAAFSDGTLALLAVSSLSWLSRRPVGLSDYPEEPWSDRVRRVFTDAGALVSWAETSGSWSSAPGVWEEADAERYLLELGELDPVLAARPAEPTTLGQYLGELVETNAAAVAQLPNGAILVQELTARKGRTTVDLDPNLVAANPEWTQVDEVANRVAVEWAGGSEESSESASIARFEERARTISTELALAADADARAERDVQRGAFPRWELSRAELLELDAELAIGDPVSISGLEDGAPFSTYLGVLEGWEDHVDQGSETVDGERVGVLEWRMILNLSPPRYSGIGVTWEAFPSSESWADAGATLWTEPELALD